MWALLAVMSKFPISAELINTAIKNRIDATLDTRGQDLEWLANEIGVTPHRLLCDFTEGLSPVILWDVAEILGVPVAWLAVGEVAA